MNHVKDDTEPQITQVAYSKAGLNPPISLDNFDPLDRHKLITSPRSIEVCRVNGVPVSSLFHYTHEEIRSTIQPLMRNDLEYLKSKYIHAENKRFKLVVHLRSLRRKLISQSTNMNRSFKAYMTQDARSKEYSRCMLKDYHELRQSAKQKSKSDIVKEIWFMVRKANKSIHVRNCQPYSENRRRVCSFSKNYLVDMEENYNKHRKARVDTYKQKAAFNATHYEKHREVESTIRAVKNLMAN
eukprot:TRINITY_DN2969_c0_g2_i1.p1 TRINITY_DN2969_c0_g2~~TRINITY_DN2969_c0_g2_i1.p1  ORF type:complete len:241 (-),score=21.36 TRINITY_DN2969_c0_g2_i1:184-906(-)